MKTYAIKSLIIFCICVLPSFGEHVSFVLYHLLFLTSSHLLFTNNSFTTVFIIDKFLFYLFLNWSYLIQCQTCRCVFYWKKNWTLHNTVTTCNEEHTIPDDSWPITFYIFYQFIKYSHERKTELLVSTIHTQILIWKKNWTFGFYHAQTN